jgi:hypothetical protein
VTNGKVPLMKFTFFSVRGPATEWNVLETDGAEIISVSDSYLTNIDMVTNIK